jgi:tetratricopeptide (TPR) repeat protein
MRTAISPVFHTVAMLIGAFVAGAWLVSAVVSAAAGEPTPAQAAFAQQPSRDLQPQVPPGTQSRRDTIDDPCFESMLNAAAEMAHCDGVISQLISRDLDFVQTRRLAAAYNNRALNPLQQPAAALEDLSAAIDLLPQWAELHLNLGNLYLHAADYPAALAAYDRALQLSQGALVAAHFNRAFVHRALGEPLQAETDLLRWRGFVVPEPVAEDAQTEGVTPLEESAVHRADE